jgi:serine/threonine protein kinase
MDQIGEYPIEAKIGEGGMGSVYKAWHPRLNIYVALKTIKSSRLTGGPLLERFKLEGPNLAKLDHPNIVRIYDTNESAGLHFIVMELMSGPGLDHIISKQEDIPLARKVGYILPICQALRFAHKRRLFHRDIKPANIMLQIDGDEEIVKVVDFGVARLLDFSHTSTNLFVGSPAYMAPELITASERANERTDIWALGVTMYELIAYQRPFEAQSGEDLKWNIVHESPTPLAQYLADCPEDLAAVLDKMLQRDPALRYQSVQDVLDDLEPIAARMQFEAAAALLQSARELYEKGDFATAKITLNEAKRYNTSNTQIRELMHKIQDELRRQELVPRLQSHLRRGREYLQCGSFGDARGEAEAALGLDSKFEPALKLLQEIEREIAHSRMVEEKIRFTRQRLSEGLLTKADQTCTELEGLDKSNPQVPELRQQITEELKRREAGKRLNQLLNQARGLLSALDYEECLTALGTALKEFPEEAELRKLQEEARTGSADLEKQRAKQREIGETRVLISQEKFEEAHVKLQQLGSLYPDDPAIQNLKTTAHEGVQLQRRRRQLEAGMAEVREMLAAEDYKGGAHKAKELLGQFPQERGVQEMVQYALAEVARGESRQKQQSREQAIRELLKAGDFNAAETEASRAVEEYRENIVFRTLLADAAGLKKKKAEGEELQRQERQREEQERRADSAVALIDADKWDEATRIIQELRSESLAPTLAARLEQMLREIRDKKKFKAFCERAEQRHREDQEKRLKEIAALLRRNDYRGAAQVLGQATAEELLVPSDERVIKLKEEIDQKAALAAVKNRESQKRKWAADKRDVRENKNIETEKSDEVESSTGETLSIFGQGGPKVAERSKKRPKEPAAPAAKADPRNSAWGVPTRAMPASAASPAANIPANQADALATVEMRLAALIGPIASILVKKARMISADPRQQFEMLASSLQSHTDRNKFLTWRDEVLACLQSLPSIESQSLAGTTILAPRNLPGSPTKIDAVSIATAAVRLAKYIGPISKVLAEKAARQADTVDALYHSLAEHLTNKQERARFLADGGFTE